MNLVQKGAIAFSINQLALALANDDEECVGVAVITLVTVFPRENEDAQEDEPEV